MKRNVLTLASLLTICLWMACNPSQQKEIGQQAVFKAIDEEVSQNSEAYQRLEEITTSIGHRLSGTQNGAAAEQFTYYLFKEYGYKQVEFRPFEMTAWQRDTVGLKVAFDAVSFDLDVVSLAHTPVEAEIEGQFINLGSGLRKDFEAQKEAVKGNIVLLDIGLLPEDDGAKNLHRSEKASLAIEYGAKGAVFVNKVPGRVLLTGTASVDGELIPLPAVCISYEDGAMLRTRLKGATAKAHILMKNKSATVQCRNVVATLSGTKKPEETILIGGHLDSWDLSQGAIDNGIGTMAIMDMARTFKALELEPERTIQFVMFMGEEQGLHGSKAMVEEMVASGAISNIKALINIDMSGNPKGYNAQGREEVLAILDTLGKGMAAANSSYQNKNLNNAGLHSDHQSFMVEGVPVITLHSGLDRVAYDFYHSDGDEFSLVNKDHMENTVRYTTMLAWGLANAELDFGQLSTGETKQLLTDEGLKEELILGKSWKWED